MEENDFIKLAYKYNKVKDLSDAFKEYPTNQEWHEGKIENVISEEQNEYKTEYKIGDIVFVKEYVYTDGKTGNNHLFVIVDQNNIAVPIENFGMLISSNLKKIKYDTNILLEKDKTNHLKKDSIVKTDIIYRILKENILFKIGKVDADKIKKYKESFKKSIIKNSD